MRQVILLMVVAAPLLALRSPAAQVPPQSRQIPIESLGGQDSFELYCASCHGSSGRGNGPIASALRTRPADLTTLTRRNNGAFPRDALRGFITGTSRTVAAHGTTEMPIWGPLFRVFESDARTRVRIENLVSHIESIQVPSTVPQDIGSQLFRTHCASCHGTSGLGNGPAADHLRRAPPDLTKYAARNGGLFPRERVYRIIDGRDVGSHGDHEMPVWGEVFKSVGGRSAAEVKTSIDAIVRYLEGIQQRSATLRGDSHSRAG